MKRFHCQNCNQELYFDNDRCERCQAPVGFDSTMLDMVTLVEDQGGAAAFHALNDQAKSYNRCANYQGAKCNWLVEPADGRSVCACCVHNNMVPDLSIDGNSQLWAQLELAKRSLFYTILRWDLPHPTKAEDPEGGLSFDFMADETDAEGNVTSVLTGHDNGLITINIAEGDDAIREQRRKAMGEPYRTLIGHFRHEIGHYYWDRLVRDGGRLDECRAIFGDDSEDYSDALKRHYDNGAPADWPQNYISSYATAHAWEDFAETWAHYLHITDAIETGRGYGLVAASNEAVDGDATIEDVRDGYSAKSAKALVNAFVPMTIVVNAINRSMGQPDLYPFVLPQPVIAKLAFIHSLVHDR